MNSFHADFIIVKYTKAISFQQCFASHLSSLRCFICIIFFKLFLLYCSLAIQIFRNCHQSLKNPYRLTTIQELYFYCSLRVCELWLTPQSESLLFCLYFFLRRKGEERSWGATTHYCTTSTRTTDSCTHTHTHTQCIVSTSKTGTLIPQMQLQHQHPPLYCTTCICLNNDSTIQIEPFQTTYKS